MFNVIFLVFLFMGLCFCIWALFNMPKLGPGPIDFTPYELDELLNMGLTIEEVVFLQYKKRLTFDEIIELKNTKNRN